MFDRVYVEVFLILLLITQILRYLRVCMRVIDAIFNSCPVCTLGKFDEFTSIVSEFFSLWIPIRLLPTSRCTP